MLLFGNIWLRNIIRLWGRILLLNDDILYYLKGHIYINDYDKMKIVSIKHRDLFNLKPILYNKHYRKFEMDELENNPDIFKK